MIAKLLFGAPSGFSARHPRLMLAAVIVLVLLSQWLVDLIVPPMEMP